MIPLLVIALGGLVAYAAGTSHAHHEPHHRPPAPQAPPQIAPPQAPPQVATATPHLTELAACVARGELPSPQLIGWAMAEADRINRSDVAQAIFTKYAAPYAPAGAATPTPAPEIAAKPVVSPFRGVTDAQWSALLDKLARADAGFTSDKRIGRYHQSRTRLAELGYEPDTIVGNLDLQNAAIAADLVDGMARLQAKGLQGKVGTKVTIPPCANEPKTTEHAISLSGLLGLLSVAGAQGAAGWLASAEDRARFPYTTSLFVATNGMF